MCFDPVTAGIMTFAVGAAQSVSTYVAAEQEQKSTEEAAQAAYREDQHQLTLREMQETDATTQKVQAENVEAAKKIADVQVSAAQGNVAGLSVENIIGDVQRQAAANRDTMFTNLQNTVAQLQEQKRGSKAQNQSRINSSPTPNPLGLIAGIGGSAISGFNEYEKQTDYQKGNA